VQLVNSQYSNKRKRIVFI